MTPPDPRHVRRILIRANNWIGDVVMISPAVRAIRRRFPEARVAMVGKRWVLDALRGAPQYDELIEYDPAGAHRGASGRLRLARALRTGGRFDLAVLFQKAFDAAVVARLAGARLRVGYATDHRGFLLTHALPPPPPTRHHAEAFNDLARAVGAVVDDPRPFFEVGTAERAAADAHLDRAGLGSGEAIVALHPGASKPPRAWHAERFAELAATLHARAGARFIVLAGPDEAPLARAVAMAVPASAWTMTPPDGGLRLSAALLQRCRLFVGNDSGPMHLAAALGVPTIGIFGPGRTTNTAPVGGRGPVRLVSRDYPCAPCRQAFFRECPPAPSGKPFCLEEITTGEVAAVALELLGALPTNGGRPL
jgi:lipopolysaccharide heptosyltransferase II